MLSLIVMLILTAAPVQESARAGTILVEVYQVLELPIGMSDVVVISADGRFEFKCLLSNHSESHALGISYSVAVVDSENVISTMVAKSEGLRLPPYKSKRVAFKMPQKMRLKEGERLVLMLEQVVTGDYIWEVLTARESLAAYIAGDYSVMPRVLRVRNHVDVPPRRRVIY